MDDSWSQHDALMYQMLSLFPEKLEGKFLDTNDFRNHFTDFYGRPIQDIAEALHLYGQKEYFKVEMMLAAEYLEQGNAIDQVTTALNQLHPKSAAPPDKYRGLDRTVYAKAAARLPLTMAEVRSLPDRSKAYLAFKLSNIDRQRLHKELTLYNDNKFIHPSRLEKNKTTGPVSHIARVFMDGRSINILIAGQVYTIAKLHQDGSHYSFMRYLLDPNNSNFAISNEDIRLIDGCKNIGSLSEHIRHCGFDISLKRAFFSNKNGKLHFWATAKLDALQYSAVRKQALKIKGKS